jgi:protein tyrosine/serine phosphatase
MKVLPTRRPLRLVALWTAGVLLLFGSYLGLLRISGNFNTVVADELYRSAQLTPDQLAHFVTQYQIKTVVNLRGNNPGREWYDDEISEARKLQIDHVDFALSAQRELTQERAAALITILRTARKPLLIHCEAGADRTGLTAALYLAVIKQAPAAVAERQLSIRFGHFSLPFIREYAMDRSFAELQRILSVSRIDSSLPVTR